MVEAGVTYYHISITRKHVTREDIVCLIAEADARRLGIPFAETSWRIMSKCDECTIFLSRYISRDNDQDTLLIMLNLVSCYYHGTLIILDCRANACFNLLHKHD
jgi:hypothetical protein